MAAKAVMSSWRIVCTMFNNYINDCTDIYMYTIHHIVLDLILYMLYVCVLLLLLLLCDVVKTIMNHPFGNGS